MVVRRLTSCCVGYINIYPYPCQPMYHPRDSITAQTDVLLVHTSQSRGARACSIAQRKNYRSATPSDPKKHLDIMYGLDGMNV